MKGSTLKKEHSKKLAKEASLLKKLQSDDKSNLFAKIMAAIIIGIMFVWVVTIFGLGLSYWLFKNDHYIWASLILVIDMLVLRSYLRTKN